MQRGEHFLGQGIEEDAFEFLGLLADLGDLSGIERGAGLGYGVHHSTSISACRAPVALMA